MSANFLDASFISQLYRVDNSCELLAWVHVFLEEPCVVSNMQFHQGSCNKSDHYCTTIEDHMSEEETIEFWMTCNSEVHLERIYDINTKIGDVYDLLAVAYAKKFECSIFSCDRKLLVVCRALDIQHKCFKSVMFDLNAKEDVFSNNYFNLQDMFDAEGDDPFFHFSVDTRCAECCDSICKYE